MDARMDAMLANTKSENSPSYACGSKFTKITITSQSKQGVVDLDNVDKTLKNRIYLLALTLTLHANCAMFIYLPANTWSMGESATASSPVESSSSLHTHTHPMPQSTKPEIERERSA